MYVALKLIEPLAQAVIEASDKQPDLFSKHYTPEVVTQARAVIAALTPRIISPDEVNTMALSADTIRLAHQYIATVEDQEFPRAAMERTGLNEHELDVRRSRIHNKFIEALRADGVDVSVSSSTTALARRVNMLLSDED